MSCGRWQTKGLPPRKTISGLNTPPAPTTTRADLAAHWQWRYSRLENDCNHTYDLLIQALADVQSYREMTHALLDALHNANKLAKRHRDTMNRLRKERQEGQKS